MYAVVGLGLMPEKAREREKRTRDQSEGKMG
jgi:hypothetical protein